MSAVGYPVANVTYLDMPTYGDADNNGVADINDALIIAQYDIGLLSEDQIPGFDALDVNTDGVVDIFDALCIAKYDIGLECECVLD